ncbi:MAG: RluA family pseudouridine synthase [Flavobacteriales bacterium]|nr:RluA family pseudouridine synthase [Flavobacteriales bacterium]
MAKKFNSKKTGKKSRQSSYTITEDTELLKFLLITVKDKSRNKIKAMLTHKQFKVGKEIITQYNHELKKGDEVTISWDGAFKKEKYEGIKIIFEDDDIIVIDKKSGLLSIGSEKEKKLTAYRIITHHIQQENPVARLFVIHRLDREASGLMVFAKNKQTQVDLKDSWQQTFSKNLYLVVTEGTIEKDVDTITSFLNESKALIVYSGNNPKLGKKAITNYSVVKKNEFFTLLEATQETERKHQIRVHLKSIGHPIIGDKKYDAKENPINRTGIHLRKINFIHPATEQKMEFETKVPEDFLKIFRHNFYR